MAQVANNDVTLLEMLSDPYGKTHFYGYVTNTEHSEHILRFYFDACRYYETKHFFEGGENERAQYRPSFGIPANVFSLVHKNEDDSYKKANNPYNYWCYLHDTYFVNNDINVPYGLHQQLLKFKTYLDDNLLDIGKNGHFQLIHAQWLPDDNKNVKAFINDNDAKDIDNNTKSLIAKSVHAIGILINQSLTKYFKLINGASDVKKENEDLRGQGKQLWYDWIHRPNVLNVNPMKGNEKEERKEKFVK